MPSSPTKYLLLGFVSLAFVACGTDRQESPLAPTSASPSASLSTTPSCSNFSFIVNDATAYFSSPYDPVFDAIAAQATAYYHSTDHAVIRNAALTVLSRVAAAAKDASLRKSTATPTVGNTLVQDVLLCSRFTGYPTDLTASLGPDGLFEVLGTAADEPASKYVKSHGTILYGAQPQTSQTWVTSTSPDATRFLLYGYLKPSSEFTLETLVPGTSAFELTAFPALAFDPKVIVGECTPGTTVYPVQHESSILPQQTLDFCPTGSAMMQQAPTGFFATLASWITPTSLNAAAVVRSESAGGLISGLSPFAPVSVAASAVGITIQQQVGSTIGQFTDKNVHNKFDVVVSIKTKNGTALADVDVTLRVSGNNGSFTRPTPTMATTNASGIAVFKDWSLDKAGGYTITATAPVLGAGLSVNSNMFHVKNK